MSEFCRKACAYLKARVIEDDVNKISLSHSDSPVLLQINNELLIAYVVDEGESFTYVQHHHLAEEGITPEQLHKYGLANLRDLAEERLRVEPYGPIYAVFVDGNFEASMILVDELWDQDFAHLCGEFVAALPARDVLAFCDLASSAGIAELNNVISRLQGSDDHPLSSSLYRRKDTNWTPYVN